MSEPRLDLTLIVHVATSHKTPKRKMIPRYGNHMSLNTIVMVLKLAATEEHPQNGKEKDSNVITYVGYILLF